MATIRVLLIDDATSVRTGLRTLLPLLAEADGVALEIAGEASDSQEAVRQAAILHPDVACVDLDMPEMGGLAAASALKAAWPATRVVAFAAHNDASSMEQARAAGVDEIIIKGTPLQGLIHRLREWRLGIDVPGASKTAGTK